MHWFRVLGTFLLLAAIVASGGACGRGVARARRAPASHLAPLAPMRLIEARRYVLALVNTDREAHGLQPLSWDPIAAAAAQRHVEDMARHGFTSHWGSDGSVPEQRYTEAGGAHMIQENAACFFDGVTRSLDPHPWFLAPELEAIQRAFLNEVPPDDGHRRNILLPTHTAVGIGLAKPSGRAQPCMTQEYTDQFGTYLELPQQAPVGSSIMVAGEVKDPVQFGGVGVARMPDARPLTVEQLNQTGVYRIPEPHELYFPAGFRGRRPVRVEGSHFAVEVDFGERPGRYQISVWGRFPGSETLAMVSLRTIAIVE